MDPARRDLDLRSGSNHRGQVPVDATVAESVPARGREGYLPGVDQQGGGHNRRGADTAAEVVGDDRVAGVTGGGRKPVAGDLGRGAGAVKDLRTDAGVQDFGRPSEGQRLVDELSRGVQMQGDVLAALHRHRTDQRRAAGDVHGSVVGRRSDGVAHGHLPWLPAGKKPPTWVFG